MSHRACVVVGDVVGSRSVEDRDRLRERLLDGLDRTNEALGDRLLAPFATLKGVDELGGVLDGPAGIDRAIMEIVEAIHPTEIRIAVAIGEIDVGVETGAIASMDGPAFHAADERLGALADAGRNVAIAGVDGPLATAVEDLLDLVVHYRSTWTDRQAEVVSAYRTTESVSAVADRLDVTPQTVSRTLQRASGRRLLAIERDLESLVAALDGSTPAPPGSEP